MTTRSLRTALLLVALTIGLLGSNFAAASPPQVAPQATAQVATHDTSMKCANAARKQAKKNKYYKYWVCVGTKAKYLKRRKYIDPALATFSEVVKPKTMRALDADDARCELVPECTVIRTLYKADIKANAFYGYADEIWGGFDVIYYQSFSGASSRYRIKLIWDWGYEIDSRYWSGQVRHNRPGIIPDDVTGHVDLYPQYIKSTAWTVTFPSNTGYWSTEPTTYRGKHHDDLFGSFVANGQIFGTSTLHLPDFHCPDHKCKYYGPTGPV